MIALGGTDLISVICLSKNINQQTSECCDDSVSSLDPSSDAELLCRPTAVPSTWQIIVLDAPDLSYSKKLMGRP